MPFDAYGVFQRLFNWRDDRDDGIKIRADRMDQEMDGIVQGLNDILQGNAGFKAPIKTVDGTAAHPVFSFSEHAGTGFYRKSDGSVGLSVDGTEVGSFPASFFIGITEHHNATDNPHNVTAAQAGALPATSYTAADILAKLLTVDGTGSGIDADLLDGAHKSDFVQTTRNIATGDGLTGGGALSADVAIGVDYASQAQAEAGTDNTTVLTPLRAKQLLLANLAGAFSQFYGLKVVDGHLLLDVGTGDYDAPDYFWSDIKPPGLTFEMTSDGHLVATA